MSELTGKHVEVEAAERGCSVSYPKEAQLQLDIDSEEQLVAVEKRIEELYDIVQVHTVTKTESRTKGHYHIVLTCYKPFTASERILAQMMFKSDTVREYMSGLRYFTGIKEPSALFVYDKEGAK